MVGWLVPVIAARRGDFFYNGGFAKQRFVKTGLLDSLQTKRACCIGLRIKIDKQNVQVHLCQRRPEIYGRGRLADAALLICDRDNFHLAEGYQSGCALAR